MYISIYSTPASHPHKYGKTIIKYIFLSKLIIRLWTKRLCGKSDKTSIKYAILLFGGVDGLASLQCWSTHTHTHLVHISCLLIHLNATQRRCQVKMFYNLTWESQRIGNGGSNSECYAPQTKNQMPNRKRCFCSCTSESAWKSMKINSIECYSNLLFMTCLLCVTTHTNMINCR